MCMQKDRAQKRRDLKGRIMLIHIKNENETAAIDTLGAELVSFMGDDGFEHIWQGDKTYWGGHAPVLFQIERRGNIGSRNPQRLQVINSPL